MRSAISGRLPVAPAHELLGVPPDDVHLVADVVPEHPVEHLDESFAPLPGGHVALDAGELRHRSLRPGDRRNRQVVPERCPVPAVVEHLRLQRLPAVDGVPDGVDHRLPCPLALEEPAVPAPRELLVVAREPLELVVGVDERYP
jgi:hypothetical protein